jgi:undecaprenol kinase
MILLFLKQRYRSVVYALRGLRLAFLTEVHIVVQVLMAASLIILGIVRNYSPLQWILITIGLGIVLVAELLNTAIERCCDSITLQHHPLIKQAKDIAAGAVLLAFIVALVIILLTIFCL